MQLTITVPVALKLKPGHEVAPEFAEFALSRWLESCLHEGRSARVALPPLLRESVDVIDLGPIGAKATRG